jgi:hypothetical protein
LDAVPEEATKLIIGWLLKHDIGAAIRPNRRSVLSWQIGHEKRLMSTLSSSSLCFATPSTSTNS